MKREIWILLALLGQWAVPIMGQHSCLQRHYDSGQNLEGEQGTIFLERIVIEIGMIPLLIDVDTLIQNHDYVQMLEIRNLTAQDAWIGSITSGDGLVVLDCGEEGCMGWLLPQGKCVEILLRFASSEKIGPFQKTISIISVPFFENHDPLVPAIRRTELCIKGIFLEN